MNNAIKNRNRLKKLLGKELRYVGEYKKTSDDGNSILLLNLKYDGKIVSDHVWIGKNTELSNIEKGAVFSFYGTADTYVDSKGDRKYGLRKCYRFQFNDDALNIVTNDNKQKTKRKGKRY